MSKKLEDGISLVQNGAIEQGMTIFKKVLKKDPQNASAHLWLGKCHLLDGERDSARESFKAAIRYGDESIKKEARFQLRAMLFNRALNLLIFDAPLRFLLIASVIVYLFSYLLETFSVSKAVYIFVREFSIYGILSLFFVWAFFIIAYLLGQLAFDRRLKGKVVIIVRVIIAVAGILVIPVNLLISYGPWLIVLASILDVFLFSLFLGRIFDWIGRKMTGESSPMVLTFLSQFTDNDDITFDPFGLQTPTINLSSQKPSSKD